MTDLKKQTITITLDKQVRNLIVYLLKAMPRQQYCNIIAHDMFRAIGYSVAICWKMVDGAGGWPNAYNTFRRNVGFVCLVLKHTRQRQCSSEIDRISGRA